MHAQLTLLFKGNPLDLLRLCRSLALATLICLPAISSPALAATQTATINANVSKPLELSWVGDFDFGSITLAAGTWSNATVSISQAGTLTCANANLTCTGATRPATYNVAGTRGETVLISAPNVTLVNQSDGTKTLTMVTSAPSGVFLTNSGRPGTNFNVGGTITLNSTTAAGTYVGTFNVTAQYQ